MVRVTFVFISGGQETATITETIGPDTSEASVGIINDAVTDETIIKAAKFMLTGRLRSWARRLELEDAAG